MSIARITMMEYLSEKEVVASESFYQTIQKDWFGNAQTVINAVSYTHLRAHETS